MPPKSHYELLIRGLEGRGQFRIKPGLERIRAVLKRLDDPQKRYPAIHVAGTNGKGSIVASLESIYRASGRRTGRYTSPHLIDLCERIAIDGGPITHAQFAAYAQQVGTIERDLKISLTYFEFVTAVAFLAFREARVDIAIVEVGLGGLWDATNVLTRPLATVVSSIGLDHTEWLGKTLAAIARQKAGIIKPGSPVISGAQGVAAREIKKLAQKSKSPIFQLHADFAVRPITRTVSLQEKGWLATHQNFNFKWNSQDHSRRFATALTGRHQLSNAALVLATVDLLKRSGKLPLKEKDIARGLMAVRWLGRLQWVRLDAGRAVLLDGAHNLQAVTALYKFLQTTLKNTPKSFVFSSYKDKNFEAMIKRLAANRSKFFICPLPSARSASVEQLSAAVEKNGGSVHRENSPSKAFRRAVDECEKGGVVVVTGSLSLVGACLEDLSRLSARSQDKPELTRV